MDSNYSDPYKLQGDKEVGSASFFGQETDATRQWPVEIGSGELWNHQAAHSLEQAPTRAMVSQFHGSSEGVVDEVRPNSLCEPFSRAA